MAVTRTTKKRSGGGKTARVTTEAHKKAMADGRRQSQHIRQYLEALRVANAPKQRGRKRTPESVQAKIDRLNAAIADGTLDPISEVKAIQERLDLRAALEELTVAPPDPAEYEANFVKAVGPYSKRLGLTYSAWRELGVPAVVLRKAKITR